MYCFALSAMTPQRWFAPMLFLVLIGASSLTLGDDGLWRIASTPDWVKPIEPWSTSSVDVAASGSGIDMRLYDYQQQRIRHQKSADFIAYEYRFVNRIGVEDYSSVDIHFDPIYQTLQLHELSIRRNERIIDKLSSMRVSLLQREHELESLIFDGEQTLNLLMSDVRVGDVLRVAYTLEGRNPIFGEHFETGIRTEGASHTLTRYHYRLEVDAQQPVHVREHGRTVDHRIIQSGEKIEYIVDQWNQPLLEEDDNVHPRFFNRGTLVFSNVESWQDVVEWALPLYQLDEQIPEELLRVASDIRQAHSSKAARIGAALHWVQDEIRYFGVELGADSHLPASPNQTLQRRFGDCKGKTLLLMALLKAMGIESSPALIDTTEDLSSPDYPWLLHAFDHVMVHVDIDGTSHWLDPTLTYQRGAVGEFHEPDYAMALILAPGVTGLSSMQNANSTGTITTQNHLSLPVDSSLPVELSVRTTRTGHHAEFFRREQQSLPIRELGERYTEYYRDIYTGLTPQSLPVRTDQPNNAFTVEENYHLTSIWQTEDGENYRWLWANDLISWLEDPPGSWKRTQPFSQSHPVDIREQWTVSMQREHEFEDLSKRIETPWFIFDKSHTLDPSGTRLVVSMRYESKVDHVLAADLDDYRKQVAEVKDNASFLIYEREPLKDFLTELKLAMQEEKQDLSEWDVFYQNAQLGGMGIGAGIAGIVVLRRRLSQRPE